MLQIQIPGGEYWNEKNEEFSFTRPYTLRLEHSLVSISKWEAKWHISFFDTKLDSAQFLSYVKCMTLDRDVPDEVYARLTDANVKDILDYIKDPMTASTVSEKKDVKGTGKKEKVTSELVYYWMVKFNIPAEYEKWHIARLIMLIRICIAKEEASNNKMSKAERYAKHAEINARNRAKFHSKG